MRPLQYRRHSDEILIRIRQGMLQKKWSISLVWGSILHRNSDRAPLIFSEARPERHINERRQIFYRDKKDRGCTRSRGDVIMGGASHPMQPLGEMLHKHPIQAVWILIHRQRAPRVASIAPCIRRALACLVSRCEIAHLPLLLYHQCPRRWQVPCERFWPPHFPSICLRWLLERLSP